MKQPHGNLFLFGSLKLNANGPQLKPHGDFEPGQLLDSGSPKTQALLAHLVLHANNPFDRRWLAFQLWPDVSETNARRNLRQYLHRVRQLLLPLGLNQIIHEVDGGRLCFSPDGLLWIDLNEFEQQNVQLQQRLDRHQPLPHNYETVLDLYQADLLPDLYEEWLEPHRESWRQSYLNLIQRVMTYESTRQNFSQAILLGQRLLSTDPCHEPTHRLLMTCFYHNHDRTRALQQYELCQHVLQAELSVAPMPETTALSQQIRAGEKLGVATVTVPQTLTVISQKSLLLNQPDPQPFVGRVTELQQLDTAWESVSHGQGQFVLLTGEVGIGKTCLVEHWLHSRCQPGAWLGWQCRQFENPTPCQPLINLLRQAETANEAHLQAQHQDSLAASFIELSYSHAAGGLTLFLDDVAWADEATWQTLAYLRQRTQNSPLLILAACQETLLSPMARQMVSSLQRAGHLTKLDLNRFSVHETEQLVQKLTGSLPKNKQQRFDSAFVQQLWQENEGVPLFLVETVKACLNQPASSEMLPFSESLKTVIEAQCHRLSEADQILLALAATIGRRFNFKTLLVASESTEERLLVALEHWLAQGFIHEEDDGYAFGHQKMQQWLYQRLNRARQRIYHRRVAEALEVQLADVRLRGLVALAHHHQLSDQPIRAVPYLLKAGELALNRQDYNEARRYGFEAMHQVRQLSKAQQASQTVHSTSATAQTVDHFESHVQLAAAYTLTGDFGPALQIIHEAERLAHEANDACLLGQVYWQTALIHWLNGSIEAAKTYGLRLLKTVEQSQQTTHRHAAWRLLGYIDVARSCYDDAISYLRDYTRLEHGLHPPVDLFDAYSHLAVAYVCVGDWQPAVQAGERAVCLAEEHGNRLVIIKAQLHLAFVYAVWHQWTDCLRLAQQARQQQAELEWPDSQYQIMIDSLQSLALSSLEQPERAVDILPKLPPLDMYDSTLPSQLIFKYLPYLLVSVTYYRQQKYQLANQQLEALLPMVRSTQNRWLEAICLRLLGATKTRLSKPDWLKAEQHLLEAADILRQIRARPDLGRTYLALRRLYDRAGEQAWAMDCHFQATTIFEELHMAQELRLSQGRSTQMAAKSVVLTNLPLKGLIRQLA